MQIIPDLREYKARSSRPVILALGNFDGFHCFAKDVTERKYQESLEIKAELIQMVSHELRTPIHSVKELIAAARQSPGQISYATYGTGSPVHLAAELFPVGGRICFHNRNPHKIADKSEKASPPSKKTR